MHRGEEEMTPQEPIETPHGWLTLINRHTGERLQLRRVPRDGEMCLELKGTLPPNQDGPPLHIHFKENEGGTVMAGTLAAEVDGVQVRIEQGGPVRLPMGSAHRWWNGGTETLQFDGFARPVIDLDRFLSAIFDVIEQRPRAATAGVLHGPPPVEASKDSDGAHRATVDSGRAVPNHCAGWDSVGAV